VSWRWVFLGVLPLLVGATVLVRPHLAGLDEAAPVDAVRARRRGRLVPAVVAAGGAGLLQYAGQVLSERPLSAVLMLVVALALLAVGVPPLLPRGAFRLGRGLPTVVVLRGVLAGAFFGAEAFLPLMLVEERSLATALAGASLTGGALTWSLGAWIQGRPGLRVDRARLLGAGFVLVLAGVALAAAAAVDGVPVVTAAVGWALAGLGMGLGLTSLSVLALELSPLHEQGASSSALQVSDALGSIVLIGTAGAVFAVFRATQEHGAAPFLVIDVVMALVLVAGAVVSPRVRPLP
jgi:hypothetical protein